MEAKELRIGNLVFIDNEKYHPKLKNIPSEVTAITQNLDSSGWTYSISLKHINQKPNTYYETYSQFIKWVKPIPLTEEWLMKFGFEDWGEVIANDHEKYQRFVLHNAIDGTSNFEVHIIKSNYGNMPHTEIVYSIDNDERQIIHNTDFVHNLQNSFYLCSGTELTIKE